MAPSTPVSASDLARLSVSFESEHPVDIVRWAAETFGDDLVFTASFEDSVLVDIVAKAAPGADVVLLDTQYLFAETTWYANELRQRYDLNLRVVEPLPTVAPDNRWQIDVEACCGMRKVEPLNRVLAEKAAWITGIRRVDAPTRANAPIVSYDLAREVVKVNPIATWSDEQVADYELEHGLLKNPLVDKGYLSIGCWPCTRPTAPGEDRRAGRWSGQGKVECGLHTTKAGGGS
jgi:phosphoadenosine phosphosulfate reductase